ncbi:MAG: hypothetical protein RL660_1953 [Bacteroidota bacterium]|jgi:hypothetical protein
MRIATVIILLLFSLNNKAAAQSTPDVKAILDSLEVLKAMGGFVEGASNSATSEEKRLDNIISKVLWQLPYSECKKLLADSNRLSVAYGYMIAALRYLDSLTAVDNQVFNDTRFLPLNTPSGIIDSQITLGQFCKDVYMSQIESKEFTNKDKEATDSIKYFIKLHAKYPESYAPIEFTNFAWTNRDEFLPFEVQHTYKLKTKSGKLEEVTNFFIFDGNLKLQLIETKRSEYYGGALPNFEEWEAKFGKKR